MQRRAFLKLGAGLVITVTLPVSGFAGSEISTEPAVLANNAIFIPGYSPEWAYLDGIRAINHPMLSRAIPRGYDGPVRLLTKLGLDGEVIQALFPVDGHGVEISPDGKIGFFGSMEHDSYVCFDPKTLDLIVRGSPFSKRWIGGGHGLFINGGSELLLTERAPKTGYKGAPDHHFGQITVREPDTLKILDSYSAQGVSPHDIRLFKDEKHIAIANYGTTFPKSENEYGLPRHIVEPSITILELGSGKLVEKIVSSSDEMELRHLCAWDFDRIFVIQTEISTRDDGHLYPPSDGIAYEEEISAPKSTSYLPAPILKVVSDEKQFMELGSEEQQALMRHGLSIHYDTLHDEVIATYPATHSIMIFDGQTGELKHRIDCTKNGLHYPCGLVVLPGGQYYAVTGYWKNLYIFERGTHKLMRDLCHYTVFFGHSHIAVI